MHGRSAARPARAGPWLRRGSRMATSRPGWRRLMGRWGWLTRTSLLRKREAAGNGLRRDSAKGLVEPPGGSRAWDRAMRMRMRRPRATVTNAALDHGPVQTLAPCRGTRAVVTGLPVVVPLGMRVLFPALARRLGNRRGHLAGFALYWTGCYLVPFGLLGRGQVKTLLGQAGRPLPRPAGWLPRPCLCRPWGLWAPSWCRSCARPTRCCWQPPPVWRR